MALEGGLAQDAVPTNRMHLVWNHHLALSDGREEQEWQIPRPTVGLGFQQREM